MHRIDTATAQKDKFGVGKNGFTRGNPQTGVPATDLDDDYFDTLQEELAAIVEAAGIALDKTQRNQVLLAAQKLFAPANDTIGALAALVGAANKLPYFTGPKAATLTDLTSVGRQIIGKATTVEVLTYLGLGEAAKLPPPKFTTGPGYTLFQSPFFDGAVVRWFSTLTMSVTPPALGNNQTYSITFPIAFSSDAKVVLSSDSGELANAVTPQDLGTQIQSSSLTGVVIYSRWGTRTLANGDFQFIATGVING